MKRRLASIALAAALAPALQCAQPERASPASAGPFLALEGGYPSLSADGRSVAFAGAAGVLVAQRGRAPVCASLSLAGQPAAGESYAPSLSGDGRRVAFASTAADLVAGDGNAAADVFVRDLAAGTTTRASVSGSGAESDGASWAPRLSADGRCVAFASEATNLVAGEGPSSAPRVWDVYRRDRSAGATVRISLGFSGRRADGHSTTPAISADGRYVAFASRAQNLVSSDLDLHQDVFVRDVERGTTRRASIGPGGLEPSGDSARPALSADGRWLAFESRAGNLLGDLRPAGRTFVYLCELESGRLVRVDGPEDGSTSASLSADGRWIAFASAESEPGRVLVRGPLR